MSPATDPDDDGQPSLNERLLDRAVMHAVYLERLKSHEVTRIVGYLNDEVFPDLVAKVESRLARIAARGYDTGPATTQRLVDLRDAVQATVKAGVRQAGKALQADLKDIAVAEAQWQHGLLQKSTPLEVDFVMPSPQTVRSVVTSRPMQGRLLRQWVEDVGASTAAKVQDEINLGVTQGETNEQIVRRIRGTKAQGFTDGVLEISRREATALVRTSVAHVSNHASETVYEENADILDGLMWSAALDTSTCLACGELDGEEFEVGKGPRPPLHWGCRCRMAPVVKGWERLGLRRPAPGTRASMNGQVPTSVRWAEWVGKQPVDIQREVLGPARFKAWKAGTPLGDFVDRRNKILTLEQLKKLDG